MWDVEFYDARRVETTLNDVEKRGLMLVGFAMREQATTVKQLRLLGEDGFA